MDKRRLREAYARYARIAEAGRAVEPAPDTPGHTLIKEHHERRMLEEHGEEWMSQTASYRRAEWEYVKWMFLDTEETVADHLRHLGLQPPGEEPDSLGNENPRTH